MTVIAPPPSCLKAGKNNNVVHQINHPDQYPYKKVLQIFVYLVVWFGKSLDVYPI